MLILKFKRGFTLLETLIVLGITAVSLYAYSQFELLTSHRNQALATTNQLNMIGAASKSYLGYNLQSLNSESFSLKMITVNTLTSATSCGTTPCLSTNVKPTSFWGSRINIYIKKTGTSAPYLYEILAITSQGTGPAPITINGKTRLDLAGFAASNAGGNIAFSIVKSGVVNVVSPSGLSLNQSDWGAAIQPIGSNDIGGQMAYYFSQAGLPYDSVYLRTDGSNKMEGNLNLGGKGIYGMGYGINNTGITAANSTSASNTIVAGALTVNGVSSLNGNVNINSGNLNVTNTATFGSALTSNGTLTVAGSTNLNSSLTVNGSTSVSGDISTAKNLVLTSATGDIKMAGLLNNHTTDSVKNLMPNLVEVASVVVGDGSFVAPPTCGAGGSARIFVIPSSAVAPVYTGSVGYVFSAVGPTAGPWTVSAKDSSGAPLAGASIALARTFCSF